MKSGYLYVLTHPSDPDLYKIGVTTLTPEIRLAQHNQQLDKCAGQVVKETGLKWELKTFIEVADHYWAEKAFWSATNVSLIPFRGGEEVWKMDWSSVEAGLAAARSAGTRPTKSAKLVRNREWMLNQLEGTGITMLTRYGGLLVKIEFQCAKGHIFIETPIPVAERKTCPCCEEWQDWWSKGLRNSL